MDMRPTLRAVGWTLEKAKAYLLSKREGRGSASDGDFIDHKNAQRFIVDEALYGSEVKDRK